ncbi:S-adenosylmethionine mitochondrial carrier protein-like [Ischnura elegans]|uniref:S-adenosylmethionine mitochondrial carrier protein-like n=1 Tax=Ischnura elegans TaxID=197161 RepID=UPI001ED897A3|nr:S-adenosylmethionine mitochondrial carrier protein-like [Ischnura elegans]
MFNLSSENLVSFIAGGAAGIAVDISLFPLDTLKTRLQSRQGFWRSGGFRGIYAGLGPAAVGSAPNAAVFFCTYDLIKRIACPYVDERWKPVVHMFAASCGEVSACVVRVPVEIVKQRCQVAASTSVIQVIRGIAENGGIRGFYQGYFSTLLREIPFSLIQFPLWEALKSFWISHRKSRGFHDSLSASQVAVCGAIAGGVSAALTTPMDVAKTRIMLNTNKNGTNKVSLVLKEVYINQGIRGLFAGVLPRVLWISIGGAIFFGVNERTKSFLLPSTVLPD